LIARVGSGEGRRETVVIDSSSGETAGGKELDTRVLVW
jgi:hypothetical protein